jgi:L-lysine 6-transaminase
VAGIVVEPIQGAGGHRVAEPEFFRQLSFLAHKYGVSLGFDEVQTAGGQVGTFFAIDQYELPHPPTAVAAAKKLANGVIYMLKPLEDVGVLDSTWGGSLADMVRFVQEMKIVREEGLIEAVAAKTERLLAGLNALAAAHADTITNVRGMGLYQGFSFLRSEDKSALQRHALQREDLLLLGAGTHSIRLRPNLGVTEAEIDLLLEKLERCLRAIHE